VKRTCLLCHKEFEAKTSQKRCGHFKLKGSCSYFDARRRQREKNARDHLDPCIRCGLVLVPWKYCGKIRDRTGCAWIVRLEKKVADSQARYQANKKQFIRKAKEWRKQNHEAYLHHERLRRYRKVAGGSHTLEEWESVKRLFNNSCAECGMPESQSKLTEDHKVPLSKGGLNTIDNIQPLCNYCNARKNAKIMFPICLLPTKQISTVKWG
jgi:5-methylcytosine-specific restriction endonuclease McrA